MINSKLLRALRNQTKKIAGEIEDSKLFDHLGDRGEFRERIIENFLQPFLPSCYGVGSGEIFASNGASSKQIDVVLYDNTFSNVLFRNGSNSLFPCESIFGTIEVKSDLNTSELEKSIENVMSVKRLERDSSDILDFLPFRRLNIGKGLTYNSTVMNPYVGIIFAYKGLRAETVEQHMNRLIFANQNLNEELLPNFIFLYEQKVIILRVGNDEKGQFVPRSLGEEFICYRSMNLGDDILPMFFLTVNICLNQIQLKSPSFNDYWIEVLNQAIERGKDE